MKVGIVLKISIIVAVYNVDKYLEKCIDSILNQSFDDYELILIDDGSFDHSSQICDKYAAENRQLKVIHKVNGGVSSARNYGMNAATGEYLMFIDGDDYIMDDCLQDIADAIAYSGSDVIIGTFKGFAEDGLEVIHDCDLRSEFINGKSKKEIFKYLKGKNFLYTAWRYIFKRDLMKDNNLCFTTGINHEDEEWSPKLLCSAKSIWLLERPFYCYRIRRGSITEGKNIKHIIDKMIVAESLYFNCLEAVTEECISLLHFRAFVLLLNALMGYYSLDLPEKKNVSEHIRSKKLLFLIILGYSKRMQWFIKFFGFRVGILFYKKFWLSYKLRKKPI